MRIERAFTRAGRDAYEGIEFRTAVSEIRNPDGSVVFRHDGIEVPSAWSQVAVDVLAQKYFRKAGVPARLRPVEEDEEGVPAWLRRRVPDAEALAALPDDALVVNVARGPVVDNQALRRECAAGRLRAALDVTDPEPLPEGDPLWSTPGVLISPHVGGGTPASYPRMGAYLHRQLTAYRDRGRLDHVVATG